MELVEALKELISDMGFPIACVVAMFWQMEKERAAHEKESAAWVEAINRNTNVIEKILARLGG